MAIAQLLSSAASSGMSKGKVGGVDLSAIMAYALFFVSVVLIQRVFSAGFSAMITLTGACQFLAFVMLTMKVCSKQAFTGLSAKTLGLYAIMYVCRLTSTLFVNGYLPVDGTGDGVYQLCDIASLAMVVFMLYQLYASQQLGAYANSCYNEEADSLPIRNLVVACVVLALVNHPGLNNSKFFDCAWTLSLYIDTVAMVPQLFMMSKGGEVETLTGHFIAAMVVSRMCALLFWYHGYQELAPEDGAMNIAGYTIIFAHILQLLFAGDFMYYYVKSISTGQRLSLPTSSITV